LRQLNLQEVRSISELKDVVHNVAATLEPGRWILGRGWDQDRFEEKRYPLRWDLDEAASENPVFLDRVCGHIAVANSAALESAGIAKFATAPEGGIIDYVLNSGEPTGILREAAKQLVSDVIPKPTFEDYVEAARAASQEAISVGLTTVHCVTYEPEEVAALQELWRRNELPLRVYVMPSLGDAEAFQKFGFRTGFGDDRLKLGPLKIFTDGSLGARTAALNEPYDDDPDNTGVLIYGQPEIDRIVREAHLNGVQLAIHAIGDRAIGVALDALERAIMLAPEIRHRHRIEHASVLSPELIERIKKVGLIASVQPRFVISDFWAGDRVGPDRARWVYPFRSLFESGIITVGGSDCPVEPIDPLEGIRSAVHRDGRNLDESLSVEEAMRIYTSEPPKASSEEHLKGALEAGKLADMVVLSADPYDSDTELAKIQVDFTIMNGDAVYERRS
jgi:predicted amidohydrolase YtcJ